MKFIPKRTFTCPQCGADVRIPTGWILGLEMVFRCPECGKIFKTGYRTGALLFGLALALALATVNLGAWIFSSVTLPVFFLAAIPLWLLYGYLFRRWRMLRKCTKARRK